MRLLRIFMMIGMLAGAVLTTATQAVAQDKVSARSGEHEDYSRLVFEWNAKPDYSLSKEGNRILIRFAKAGTLDSSGVLPNDKNIKSVSALSAAGESLQVAVTIPQGSRFRDFIVENKLVVDVYDSEIPQPKTPPATQPEPKAAPVKETVEPAAVTPTLEGKKEGGDFSVTRLPDAVTAPTTPVDATALETPVLEDHEIALTGMFSVGMAAFERNGTLWIIIDTPDIAAKPVLSGPQKDKFGPLTKIEIPEGLGYRMEIPEGMKAYGDGGGLSWKITLSAQERKLSPVEPLADQGGGEAELVWPLRSMRKTLTFPDPVVGDTITVVTAGEAAQFAGPARIFVNLNALNSVIGLAYAAKSDGVSAKMNTQQVRVGRVGGMAVSSKIVVPAPHDVIHEPEEEPEPEVEETAPEDKADAPEQDKDHADLTLTEPAPAVHEEEQAAHDETEAASTEEMSAAAEEKPGGNNIYNFARWEMGGIHALDRNQHVMMTNVSAKADRARDEDIITMAKINLANNRGAEALGLLRISLQKMPELDGNVDFQSLRAAGLALSGKYDEAIMDYSRDDLRKYDDVKIWRVFTLAGLEDWKQAIAEMPQDVSPIASYPLSIRAPIALALAEVALRAGKVPLAKGILKTLQADIPSMPLPHVSAWQYLSGEADRQGGQPDAAIAKWEPLVKSGRDDLFRAKAGLSLTKLKLDQKKIKPAEAVDLLEGLRYAWRGDELETLINYRLGQVYIDNKDYLKGLTVLRNATLFSPGTVIGNDLQAYMVKSFRDIFINQRLKDISPLEAISLYEEFKDLTPPGDVGDRFVETLAERLVDADLLGRASALLEYHVNNRLKGERKAEISIRLAAIRLLDRNPDGALRSLEIAQDILNKPAAAVVPPPAATDAKTASEAVAPATAVTPDPEKQRQIYLLKARALSMKKKTDEALAILQVMQPDPDVNRLRADISWTSGKWDESADALNDLIVTEDISARRPLTDYQRDIIFNRGIALNLSGNRVALANLRDRYLPQMKDTAKGQMFEIVTRSRRPDMIGSREAIESMISEIDLFQGFLDGYGKMDDAGKEDAKEPAAPKEPVPADGKAVSQDTAKPAAAAEQPPEKKPAEKAAAAP